MVTFSPGYDALKGLGFPNLSVDFEVNSNFAFVGQKGGMPGSGIWNYALGNGEAEAQVETPVAGLHEWLERNEFLGIPYILPNPLVGWCSHPTAIHQNVPTCGRVCSDNSSSWRGFFNISELWAPSGIPCEACPNASSRARCRRA